MAKVSIRCRLCNRTLERQKFLFCKSFKVPIHLNMASGKTCFGSNRVGKVMKR